MTPSRHRDRWDADTAVEQLYAAHYAPAGPARRCCCVARRRDAPRRSCRTPSSRCTAAGGRCASPTRRWPTCARRSSTGPARCCATAASCARHVARPLARPARRRRRTRWPPSDARAVLDALRALPDRQREVLALRYYLDLSEADIAETLGISRGAVKSHASRGVAALRTLMEDVS